MFGTRIGDRFSQINLGRDIAFLGGALRHLIERGWTDEDFISRCTSDFDAEQRAGRFCDSVVARTQRPRVVSSTVKDPGR